MRIYIYIYLNLRARLRAPLILTTQHAVTATEFVIGLRDMLVQAVINNRNYGPGLFMGMCDRSSVWGSQDGSSSSVGGRSVGGSLSRFWEVPSLFSKLPTPSLRRPIAVVFGTARSWEAMRLPKPSCLPEGFAPQISTYEPTYDQI